MDTSAQDILNKADAGGSVSSSTDNADGLSAFGGGVSEEEPVELDPVEETVLRYVRSVVDGQRIRDLTDVPVEAFLGLVPLDSDEPLGSVDDTPFDPDHDVWDQPGRADGWVTSKAEARREIKSAMDGLIQKGIVTYDEIHERNSASEPLDATLAVDPPPDKP